MAKKGKVHIPVGLDYNRAFLALLQQFADRTKPIAAVDDLNQTISNPPTQAEVQAISDKTDELLAAMRSANVVEE